MLIHTFPVSILSKLYLILFLVNFCVSVIVSTVFLLWNFWVNYAHAFFPPMFPSQLQSDASRRDLEEWDSMMKELDSCGDPSSQSRPSPSASAGIPIGSGQPTDAAASLEPFVSASRTDDLSVQVGDEGCSFRATPSSLGSAYEPTNELLQQWECAEHWQLSQTMTLTVPAVLTCCDDTPFPVPQNTPWSCAWAIRFQISVCLCSFCRNDVIYVFFSSFIFHAL